MGASKPHSKRCQGKLAIRPNKATYGGGVALRGLFFQSLGVARTNAASLSICSLKLLCCINVDIRIRNETVSKTLHQTNHLINGGFSSVGYRVIRASGSPRSEKWGVSRQYRSSLVTVDCMLGYDADIIEIEYVVEKRV